MGLVTIELDEADLAALVELFENLSHFNQEMPNDFSVIIQHALMDSVKKGCLDTETAFDVFGQISRLTTDLAYHSERITKQLSIFSAFLTGR